MPESDKALIFGARALAENLLSRHNFRFRTEEICFWAGRCAASHGSISGNPAWWITSALKDIECLDACFEMLKELRTNGGK